uniref:Uncharacterized protein n=1 Tax=Chromera velia CCMP2878 TaxID=1169474 RepID=A0A0G4G587_9ALVE|eukprot:Cvel_20242.t1-p1 / transcript=Cvel_20242.t1 / gene=Cvel_20242 / organism=Chromera_velia_CCMP2878 / gene_product=hypothetical protein / transcript_product=hypothetical protein / location=Cvel_scaffold1804:3110-6435(+) / protein_length=185 / sequence_SO=supercontig / SO=protein_coding / is_pseudo=false
MMVLSYCFDFRAASHAGAVRNSLSCRIVFHLKTTRLSVFRSLPSRVLVQDALVWSGLCSSHTDGPDDLFVRGLAFLLAGDLPDFSWLVWGAFPVRSATSPRVRCRSLRVLGLLGVRLVLLRPWSSGRSSIGMQLCARCFETEIDGSHLKVSHIASVPSGLVAAPVEGGSGRRSPYLLEGEDGSGV